MNRLLLIALSSLSFFSGTLLADVKVGAEAPAFTLKSVEGKTINLSDYKGKTVVLEWFNFGCPFVRKHYAHGNMQSLQAEAVKSGVIWLTINSTNPEHENFLEPAKAAAQAKELKMKSTALLADPEGEVGKLYGAKSTPHMFIIGPDGKIAYQGAIDDNSAVDADPSSSKNYVRQALREIAASKPVTVSQTKQYGCGVKYR